MQNYNIPIRQGVQPYANQPIQYDYESLRQALNNMQVANQNQINQATTYTPSQYTPLSAEELAALRAQQEGLQRQEAEQTLRNSLKSWNPFGENRPFLNIVPNIIHDVKEMGQGFVSAFNPNTWQPLKEWVTEVAPYETMGQRAGDIYDALYGDLTGLTSERISRGLSQASQGDFKGLKETGKETLDDFLTHLKEDPLITSMIVAPGPTNKVIGSGLRQVGRLAESAGVPVGEVTQKIGRSIDTINAKLGDTQAQLREAGHDISRASKQDLNYAVDALTGRNGLTKSDLNTPKLKKVGDAIEKFQDTYNLTYDEAALVNPTELAALQYVRDSLGGDVTLQEVRRNLGPQLDELMAGVEDPALKFENRLDRFEHEASSLIKNNKKNINLKDNNKLLSELTKDEQDLISRHFSPEELAAAEDAGINNVGGLKQYLRDWQRDVWSGDLGSKAAKNARFQENLAKLAGRALETGDPALKYLHEGLTKALAGEIKPITFMGAEIPEGTEVSNAGRRFAGVSSSREYGTATTPAIVDAYKNVHSFIDDTIRNKVNQEVSRNLLETGTVDGETALREIVNPKDARYVSRELLSEGKLYDAVKDASKTERPNTVAVDKRTLSALQQYSKPMVNPFGKGTLLSELYNLAKDTFLASGNYLGGNILSGALGTSLNSGSLAGLVNDLVHSIGSKGRLAKSLNIWRDPGLDTRKFSTKVGNILHKGSRLVGGAPFTWIDANAQNFFAEMNANALLRRQGIASADRVAALDSMPKAKLGQLISDVKNSSMMNNRFRLIPNQLRGALGIINPFADWLDTSMQASYHMYAQHPYLVGMTAADLLGNLAVNQEIQNRLNLGVSTDKMLKSYKPDPKTGEMKEITVNFAPQLTSIELLSDPQNALARGVPGLTAILNASQGKDVYGRPLKRTYSLNQYPARIQDGRRYWVNPKTGMWEPINDTLGDEVLSTTLRNLSGIPQAVNKTYGPIGTAIWNAFTGDNRRWYLPYEQSIFGSTTPYKQERGEYSENIVSTGNPAKQRTLGDVLKGLGTYYETTYYPEDEIKGSTIRRIIRGASGQARRDYARMLQGLE